MYKIIDKKGKYLVIQDTFTGNTFPIHLDNYDKYGTYFKGKLHIPFEVLNGDKAVMSIPNDRETIKAFNEKLYALDKDFVLYKSFENILVYIYRDKFLYLHID